METTLTFEELKQFLVQYTIIVGVGTQESPGHALSYSQLSDECNVQEVLLAAALASNQITQAVQTLSHQHGPEILADFLRHKKRVRENPKSVEEGRIVTQDLPPSEGPITPEESS